MKHLNRIMAAATASVAAVALAAIPVTSSASTSAPPSAALIRAVSTTRALFNQTYNWAGYEARATHPNTDPMKAIGATFTIPKTGNCAKSLSYDGRTTPVYSEAAMWAGLGGDNDPQLEQAGIVMACATKNGPAAYLAFSEMLPAQQTVQLTNGTGQLETLDGNWITPQAGDTIVVIVQDVANTLAGTPAYQYYGAPAGHNFTMQVSDTTQDAEWFSSAWVPQAAAPSADQPNIAAEPTAEVITEAVSGGLDNPSHFGVADTGTVDYHDLFATDYGDTWHGLSSYSGQWKTKSLTVGSQLLQKTLLGISYPSYVYQVFGVTPLHNQTGDQATLGAGDHAFSTYWG